MTFNANDMIVILLAVFMGSFIGTVFNSWIELQNRKLEIHHDKMTQLRLREIDNQLVFLRQMVRGSFVKQQTVSKDETAPKEDES
jgi:hypothetical protein